MAIAAVFLYHAQGYAIARLGEQSLLWDAGYRGVLLFFVISGFILGLPFARHYLLQEPAVETKKYLLRRVTRLEPPYVLNMAICFVLLYALHKPAGWSHLLASILYVHNVAFQSVSTVNAVAWSLEVEVQFYLLMPLIAQIYRLRSRRTILAALIAGFGLLRYFTHPLILDMTLVTNVQFFLAGMLLADLYLMGDWSRKSLAWDMASLALWPMIFVVKSTLFLLFMPAVCMVLYAAAFRGPLSSRLFSFWPISAIGTMCYSIYLCHYQVISFIGGHIHNVTAFYLISALAVLAVSGTYFFLIERPCMYPDWPRAIRNLGSSKAAAHASGL